MKVGYCVASQPREIPASSEVERMLVAVGTGRAVVLEVSGACVEAEMMNDAEGLHREVQDWCPSEEGICVWEGVPEGQWCGEFGARTEFDGYKFAPEGFRDPTPEEWEAIRAKKRPWPYVGAFLHAMQDHEEWQRKQQVGTP